MQVLAVDKMINKLTIKEIISLINQKNKIPKKSFPKQIANKSLLKSTNTNKRRLENPTIETNIDSAIIALGLVTYCHT